MCSAVAQVMHVLVIAEYVLEFLFVARMALAAAPPRSPTAGSAAGL